MISVVIPTYNEEKNIERALNSLNNQTIPRNTYEIIIVDGDSKDQTREIAKKLADKVIIQTSKGVGGARNDGVAVAKGDIIATTDADCIVPTDWLERIQKNFENNKLISIYGATVPLEDDLLFNIMYKSLNLISPIIQNSLKLYYPCGQNTAFLKSAFESVGGYSNISVCDDVEIGSRLKKIGKMKLDNKMVVKGSIRRLKKNGIFRSFKPLITNMIRLALGSEIKNVKYAKTDY